VPPAFSFFCFYANGLSIGNQFALVSVGQLFLSSVSGSHNNKRKKGLKSIFVKPFEEHTDKGTDIKMIINGPNSENFLIKNS